MHNLMRGHAAVTVVGRSLAKQLHYLTAGATKRASFDPQGKASFAQIAMKYAGASSLDDPATAVYANGYSGSADHPGLAINYFGRFVPKDEILDLAIPDTRWSIAQTIFHFEAGRRSPLERSKV